MLNRVQKVSVVARRERGRKVWRVGLRRWGEVRP